MRSNFYTTHISILPTFSFLILKNTLKPRFYHIYMYNDFFFYKLDSFANDVGMFVDRETNTVIYQHKQKKEYNVKFKNIFKNFLFTLDNYYFEKIRFAGKGYRVVLKKKKKRMKFKFGHSHKKMIFFKNIHLKKYHKYKFILYNNNKKTVTNTALLVCAVKPTNLYTKRGIRRSRQILF